MMRKKRKKGRRLNDKVVADLPLSSKQYTIWDLSVDGCGVRVSARTKACIMLVRLGKDRTFRTIGTVTPDSPYETLREKATRVIAGLKREAQLEKFPGEPTVSEVIDDYAAAHPDTKGSSVEDYRYRLGLYFKAQLKQPISRLTTDEILRLNAENMKALEAKDPVNKPPHGFYSYQASLRSLRALVRWQAARKKRPNPWPDPRVLRIKTPPARELPLELQCAAGRRRLVEGLKAIDSQNSRGCLFLCYTGLRRKEGMALVPGNLLSDTVVEFASKTRKLRVPLSRQAACLMDKHSPTTLLKAKASKLRKPLIRIFGTYKTSRGIKARVTPHDLRRLFKSIGTELGIDPTILDLLVGHAIKGVNKSYIAKLRLSILKESAQKIADEIDNPTEAEGEEDILTLSLGRSASDTANSDSDHDNSKMPLAHAIDYLGTGGSSIEELRRHSHYLTREQMHELVWTVPMWELKDQFGMSDRGLAKLCNRSGIPVPGRGYWAKIEAGQLIERVPLCRSRSYPRIVRIRGKVPPPSIAAARAA